MKSLNTKAIAHFMTLVDQMAGQPELRITNNKKDPLTLTLIATDIYSNSRQATGNLYKLVFSDSPDGSTENPGMEFLVVDRRTELNQKEAVQIYPVSYKHDALEKRVEIVTIRGYQVYEVNIQLQKTYVHSANQWLKNLNDRGYITEQLEKVTSKEELACICGNNSQFDGFADCDEVGIIKEPPNKVPNYCLCLGCHRIIDLKTFEVVAKAKPVKSPDIPLDINKSLLSMSDAEKAKLLHVLCPETMRGFLTFVGDRAQKVIASGSKTEISGLNETLSDGAWNELAKNVSQIISTSLNRLVDNSDLFAKELFRGYNKSFLFHCLEEYITFCQNARFTRGIEFIFDL